MTKRFMAVATGLAALGLTALPQDPAAARSAPAPGLVVAIAVDQLSADLFAQYRPHFTGGLRRLGEGAVFPSGYQSHALTETCPGHATILTGVRPGRAGVIANEWIDQGAARADKTVYCAEDETVPGSSSRAYRVSPVHLRVPTLGDLMRRRDARARVVVVAGKDRSAAMMGGHAPTQLWWWNGGAFVSHAGVTPSPAVASVDAEARRALASARDPSAIPTLCQTRARPVAVYSGTVGEGRFARGGGQRRAFLASPEFDAHVLALAEGLRDELGLGEGEATDLLAIGLSATDYVGHDHGTQGPEMCANLLALDQALGRFLARLDEAGIDYVVMLTADHGGQDIPERSSVQAGHGAERAEAALAPAAMGQAIAAELGLAQPVLHGVGIGGDVYLDRSLGTADRQRALDAAVRAYRGHRQVMAVFTRAELEAAPVPAGPPDAWTPLDRVRASFDAERSGDFYVLLRPRIVPVPAGASGSITTHNGGWDQDRRVPILFWRRGLAPFEQPYAVETIDIMPTLAALIGLVPAPGSIDGTCLDLDAGPQSSCGEMRGAPAPGPDGGDGNRGASGATADRTTGP